MQLNEYRLTVLKTRSLDWVFNSIFQKQFPINMWTLYHITNALVRLRKAIWSRVEELILKYFLSTPTTRAPTGVTICVKTQSQAKKGTHQEWLHKALVVYWTVISHTVKMNRYPKYLLYMAVLPKVFLQRVHIVSEG